MNSNIFACRTETLNGRVGAITLAVAALATLLLSHTALPLTPLRILTVAVAAFATWAFCDEMGLMKPLNRVGLVVYLIAVAAKLQILMGLAPQLVGRYDLLYATFTLLALMFWSIAFLHRKRDLKMVGAVGLLATLTPIGAVIAGHLIVGLGATIGVQSMLEAAQGASPTDLRFVTTTEFIFSLWGFMAAWLLWRGHVVNVPK